MKIKEVALAQVSGNFNDDDNLKVGIKLDKVDKLFDILIGGYNNPRASFVREGVSNAWDAMREINNPNPVIVRLNNDDGGYYIEIVDAGVGMDYTFITERYTQVLDSTKDENNDQIGGFGIGRMSPLAYQTNFLVSTVKNGLLNKFNIYRQTSGMPDITLLVTEEETDEPSGTTVKIYLKDEDQKIDNYNKVPEVNFLANVIAKELSFFDNVVFEFTNGYNYYAEWDLKKIQQSYNNGKIIESDLFKWRTSNQYSDEMHLVLGKVCYPINWNTLGIKRIEIPIGVKFDIGEIQVNMTREAILYSDDAITLIKERIEKVKADLVRRYNDQNEPVDHLFQYIEKVKTFKENSKYFIKFDIGAELPYVLNISELFESLKPVVFKPLLHIKNITHNEIKDVLYPFIVHSKRIVDGRETKNHISLTKYWNEYNILELSMDSKPTIVLLDKGESIPDSKEFRKYIQNCIFVSIRPLAKYYYEDYLLNLGVKIIEEKINKRHVRNVRIHPDTSLINEYDTSFNTTTGTTTPSYNSSLEGELVKQEYYKKVNVKTRPIGIIKDVVEYKKVMVEQLQQYFTVINYKSFAIPEEWKVEQKRLAKEARAPKTKLEGIIPYKNIITNYTGELNLSTLQNFKGILIYGFLKDKEKLESVTRIVNCNKPFKKYKKEIGYDPIKNKSRYKTAISSNINPYAIRIIRISQSNEYLFHKLSNAVYVNLFMLSNNKVMCRLIECIKIKQSFSHIYEDSTMMNILKSINFNIFLAMKEVSDYTDKYLDFRTTVDKTTQELLDLDKLGIVKYQDPVIRPVIEFLNEYFEGCELLKSCVWNEENIPYIVEFLKLKDKKLNYVHYKKGEGIVEDKPCAYTGSFGLIDPQDVIANPHKYTYRNMSSQQANEEALSIQRNAEQYLCNEESTPESDSILKPFNMSEGEE